MRVRSHSFNIAILAGISLFASWNLPALHAQDKDAEIERLRKKENARLVAEVKLLNEKLRDSEAACVEIAKAVRSILIKQNEEFLERWRDALKPTVQSTEPNPPATKIDGKIEKVEGTLVQTSIGTDHGIKERHTLYVYRLKPEVKYLGMIRIIDSRHHTSVGRLIYVGKAEDRPIMKEGDHVTSELPLKVELKKKIEPPKNDDKGLEKKGKRPPAGNDPLAPPEKIDGKVEKVDGNLVRINVGKDHGIALYTMLDVYRLQPDPAYLGTIRIVEVTSERSVGRFQPQGKQSTVKDGDLVTSKFK